MPVNALVALLPTPVGPLNTAVFVSLAAGVTDNWIPSGFQSGITNVIDVTCDMTGSYLNGLSAGQQGGILWLRCNPAGGNLFINTFASSSTGINQFSGPVNGPVMLPSGANMLLLYQFAMWCTS